MSDDEPLTPLERGWSAAMKQTPSTECPSAEVLLEVSEKGKRSKHFERCMNHVACCASCTQLLLELREANELSRTAMRRRPRVVFALGGGLAVAASIVAGVLFYLGLPHGNGTGPTPFDPVAGMVASVRANGILGVPAELRAYDAFAGVERGDGEVPELISPIATWVDTTDVQLRWKPAEGAARYDVLLQPGGAPPKTLKVGNSVQTPSGTLKRGETYRWQVIAKVRDAEKSSPIATFRVLSDAESAKLAKQTGDRSDHLTLAVLCARYGLLERADTELKLVGTGPDAELAAALRKQLAKRRFVPGAP